MLCGKIKYFIRHVAVGKQSDRLGERQRRALALGEERCLAPHHDGMKALFGLSRRSGVLRVHVDAVGAAVELGCADADKFAERPLDPGEVGRLGCCGVECVHRRGDAAGKAVEVEPRDVLGDCHGSHATTELVLGYGPFPWLIRGPFPVSTCTSTWLAPGCGRPSNAPSGTRCGDVPPALVVGYGTPPEHSFAGALDALCRSLTSSDRDAPAGRHGLAWQGEPVDGAGPRGH